MFLKFSLRSMFYGSLTLLTLLQAFCILKGKLSNFWYLLFSGRSCLNVRLFIVFEGKGKWKGSFQHIYMLMTVHGL